MTEKGKIVNHEDHIIPHTQNYIGHHFLHQDTSKMLVSRLQFIILSAFIKAVVQTRSKRDDELEWRKKLIHFILYDPSEFVQGNSFLRNYTFRFSDYIDHQCLIYSAYEAYHEVFCIFTNSITSFWKINLVRIFPMDLDGENEFG